MNMETIAGLTYTSVESMHNFDIRHMPQHNAIGGIVKWAQFVSGSLNAETEQIPRLDSLRNIVTVKVDSSGVNR